MPEYEGKQAEQVRRRAPLGGYGQAVMVAAIGSLFLMWSAATGASENAPLGVLLLLGAVWCFWQDRPTKRLIVSVTVTDHAITGFTDIGDEFTVPWGEVTAVTEIWRDERRAGRLLVGLELTCLERRPIGLYRFVSGSDVPAWEEPGLSEFEELAAHIQAHTPRAVHRHGAPSMRSPR